MIGRGPWRVVMAFGALALLAGPVLAQKQVILRGPAPGTPPLLPALCEKLDWDPASRGVLLVVAPEKALGNRIDQPRADAPTRRRRIQAEDVPPPNGPGYSLLTLEKYVDRKAMPVGSVTVFAPKTMDVLNWQRLPEPSATAALTEGQALLLWEATLTPTQWKRYASPEGIGVGDLDREQAKLFQASLPDDAVLSRFQRTDGGILPAGPSTRLTPSQRTALRRTMGKRLTWQLEMRNGNLMSFADWLETVILQPPPRIVDASEDAPGTILGQTLRSSVPNRPKPGHIDFANAALSVPVDLAGAKTVGDLVKRCADAVRVPIHCDPRYASLTVFVRGDSARAGDLLKAVALGVTGTYRKVGADYVLTDDLTPLGTRLAAIHEWLDAHVSLTARLLDDAHRKIGDQPDAVAPWPSDDDRPDPRLEARLAEIRRLQTEPWGEADTRDPGRRQVRLPIDQMPKAVAKRIKAQLEMTKGFSGDHAIVQDTVLPEAKIARGYFLPGVGPIRDTTGIDEEAFRGRDMAIVQPPAPEPVPLPRGATTAVLIDATDAADAEGKVASAKRAGFDAVWVATSDAAALRRAVAAGQRLGIPVHAALRLARTRADDPEVDLTVRGEPASRWAARHARIVPGASVEDWSGSIRKSLADDLLRYGDPRRTDRPQDRNHLAARLAAAAQPGVAGVVVLDAHPSIGDPTQLESQATAVGQTGYTPEMRLACLREHGVDPADIFAGNTEGYGFGMGPMDTGRPPSLLLPFFGTGAERAPGWVSVRKAAFRALMDALRRQPVSAPVLFHQPGTVQPWFGSLDKGLPPDRPAPRGDFAAHVRRSRADAEASSTRRVEAVRFYRFPSDEPVESQWNRWTVEIAPRTAAGEGHRVYDLTAAPSDAQARILAKTTLTPAVPERASP